MMELKILKWEFILDYLCGPSVATMVLISNVGGRRVRVSDGEVTMEAGKSNALASLGDETRAASGN